jgi:hypothetical protein
VQSNEAAKLVPRAAIAAGLDSDAVPALLAALPLGSSAISQVPGITNDIAAAAGGAFQQSYVVGLRTTCLSSLSFGILGIIGTLFHNKLSSLVQLLTHPAALCCQDIGKKMNNKIEVFLENDENADKNRFH